MGDGKPGDSASRKAVTASGFRKWMMEVSVSPRTQKVLADLYEENSRQLSEARKKMSELKDRLPYQFALSLAFGEVQASDPGQCLFVAARIAMQTREAPDVLEDGAVDRLVRELLKRAKGFSDSVGITGLFEEYNEYSLTSLPWEKMETRWLDLAGANAADPPGGLLPLDAKLTDYIQAIGQEGKKIAAILRIQSCERWQKKDEPDTDPLHLWRTVWRPTEHPMGESYQRAWDALATALWIDVVRPALDPPVRAMPQAVLAASLPIFQSSTQIEVQPAGFAIVNRGHTVGTVRDGAVARIARQNELPPGVYSEALRKILADRFKALSTAMGLDLFAMIVRDANEQLQSDRTTNADSLTLHYVHGLAGIAKRLGKSKYKGATRQIRQALDALMGVTLPVTGSHGEVGHTALVQTWEPTPAEGRQPALVTVTVGPALLGGQINRLSVFSHLLTPVPPPEYGMPVTKSLRYLPKEKALGYHVMLYMTDQSMAFVDDGGYHFDKKVWRKLAGKAELPAKRIDTVVPLYEAPRAGLFPWLRRTASGLYVPGYPGLAKFFTVQGDKRKYRRKGGKASKNNRSGK